ncbi:MAG: hypothetical protein IJW32_04325 [Clostridia bacterium]|nr:hypothetical protein [Clostridia bacterium]
MILKKIKIEIKIENWEFSDNIEYFITLQYNERIKSLNKSLSGFEEERMLFTAIVDAIDCLKEKCYIDFYINCSKDCFDYLKSILKKRTNFKGTIYEGIISTLLTKLSNHEINKLTYKGKWQKEKTDKEQENHLTTKNNKCLCDSCIWKQKGGCSKCGKVFDNCEDYEEYLSPNVSKQNWPTNFSGPYGYKKYSNYNKQR